MDDKKICFIICSNNQLYLDECLFYISQLEIPEGYSVDVMSIAEAKSMTSGYNEGMKATDAKYKVYIHQDVFILYKGFLKAVIDIFKSDSKIGMIGMVGAPKMSASGVMWFGMREGSLYMLRHCQESYQEYEYRLEDGLHDVEAVDGLMIITSVDLPWREDIFDGWDYYDVSQSFEFLRKGYRVVVPEQRNPWCLHEDGILNFSDYDSYVRKGREEYPEFFQGIKTLYKRNEWRQECQVTVLLVVQNQSELLRQQLRMMELLRGNIRTRIIVVDNGSEDGLCDWLQSQQKVEYICWELARENYAVVLNTAIREFEIEQDILLVSPIELLLPGCLDIMYGALHCSEEVGAIAANLLHLGMEEVPDLQSALTYVQGKERTANVKGIGKLPVTGVMIKNQMVQQIGGFDETHSALPGVLEDFSVRASREGFVFYEMEDAYICQVR